GSCTDGSTDGRARGPRTRRWNARSSRSRQSEPKPRHATKFRCERRLASILSLGLQAEHELPIRPWPSRLVLPPGISSMFLELKRAHGRAVVPAHCLAYRLIG